MSIFDKGEFRFTTTIYFSRLHTETRPRRDSVVSTWNPFRDPPQATRQ